MIYDPDAMRDFCEALAAAITALQDPQETRTLGPWVIPDQELLAILKDHEQDWLVAPTEGGAGDFR